jgi:regulator of protease activity HflC (stomatin/prohibitin superfamily)
MVPGLFASLHLFSLVLAAERTVIGVIRQSGRQSICQKPTWSCHFLAGQNKPPNTMTRQSFLVTERLWAPSVLIHQGELGVLVQPGSNHPPMPLEPGWQFHWPLLSVIRVFHRLPITHRFNAKELVSSQQFGDEAIVAVSRDLHLFTIEGEVVLQLSPSISTEQLAHLNKYHAGHLIRPMVRQSARQLLGKYLATTFPLPSALSEQWLAILRQDFIVLGIDVHAARIQSITPFQPKLSVI